MTSTKGGYIRQDSALQDPTFSLKASKTTAITPLSFANVVFFIQPLFTAQYFAISYIYFVVFLVNYI